MSDKTSDSDKTSGDVNDLLYKQLRGELKDDLEEWSRRNLSQKDEALTRKHEAFTRLFGVLTAFFALVSFVIALFSLVGIPAIIDKTLGENVNRWLTQQTERFAEFQQQSKNVLTEATLAATKAEQAVAHTYDVLKGAEEKIDDATKHAQAGQRQGRPGCTLC